MYLVRGFLLLGVFLAALSALGSEATAGDAVQLAQNPAHVCFNDCVEENGTDAKGACARKCGLAGGMSQPKRDCGTEYKACKKACGKKDKDCKKACRTTRKNCS